MKFHETKLAGAFLIEIEKLEDERGFFGRSWCQNEAREHGIKPDFVQCNISFNIKKGTLRGMHYQEEPYSEAKLVRCTKGAIYDVIVDLRPESSTYLEWFAVELDADRYNMLYIPERFAHGFLTLTNNTEVFYQMANYYVSDYAKGIRWDDPALGIQWPFQPLVISQKDMSYGDLKL